MIRIDGGFCEIGFMNIKALLLAAGLSSRMKGPNKLLLPFKEASVISCTYQALKDSRIAQIMIVTGRDAGSVKSIIQLGSADQFIHNKHFELGMTSSIQAGLKALTDCDALMICLGDMPWLKASDYDLLLAKFERQGNEDSILVPWFDEFRANPVIFGSKYFNDILKHKETTGCAQIIRDNRENVLNVNINSDRFIKDIDTLDDIEFLD